MHERREREEEWEGRRGGGRKGRREKRKTLHKFGGLMRSWTGSPRCHASLPMGCLAQHTVGEQELPDDGHLPGGSADKEPACTAGDLGSVPRSGRSPGEGNSYPLQYSGLENSRDYTVRGVAKNRTRWSNFHFHFLRMGTETGKDLSTLKGAIGPQAHPLPTARPQVLHLQRKEDTSQSRSGRF